MIVVEPKSRTASGRVVCVDDQVDARLSCEVNGIVVELRGSSQVPSLGSVSYLVAVPSASLKTSYAFVGL